MLFRSTTEDPDGLLGDELLALQDLCRLLAAGSSSLLQLSDQGLCITGSDQFPRVKIGVGAKPHPDYDLAKWVLSRFSSDEQKALDSVLDHAADMARLIVSGRMDEAMNGYNGK